MEGNSWQLSIWEPVHMWQALLRGPVRHPGTLLRLYNLRNWHDAAGTPDGAATSSCT